LPADLPNAIKHLDDQQFDRLVSAVVAEQKRRGKKLSMSDESPRKGRVESAAVPLTQGKVAQPLRLASRLRGLPDTFMNSNRARISTLAIQARLPTIYVAREYVEAGGLMSYGANIPHLFARAAELVDKILRDTKPGDIPVEQPTKFELVINLKTAKALGLSIPQTLLATADNVIE
jgi:ABC transporter substrate binding protein